MAISIERAPDHRNVLLVTGNDLYPPGNTDPAIVTPLEAAAASVSPVKKGSHDFWIVFSVGSTGAPNAGGQDPAAVPRPLRGAVTAKSPPTSHDVATMTDQVTTLLQEVGHYWLAYQSLKFHWNNQLVSYDPADWVRFNTETPFKGPLLGGRTNQHWAAWFHSDGSPLGGQNWTDTSRDGPLDRWQWQPRTGPVVHPAGLPAMTMRKKFCDLDLLVMGAKTASECYPETGGRFSWLEPQFVVQPQSFTTELRTAYLAGVFVAYSATEYIYFGFDTDHRRLGVYRTNGTSYGTADLGPTYQPGWVHNSGVALRVIRNGRTLYFQARYDESATGLHVAQPDQNLVLPAPPAQIPGLFDGIPITNVPHSGPDFTTFRTVATVTEPAEPVAIGLLVKTSSPVLVDTVYYNLETRQLGSGSVKFDRDDIPPLVGHLPGGVTPPVPPRRPAPDPHRIHHLVPLPDSWHGGNRYDQLPTDTPVLHVPVAATDPPQAQVWRGRLRLQPVYDLDLDDGDPANPPYDHTATQDRAPKVLLRAPTGNFAFGTSVTVRRTLFTHSSGGGPPGTILWGRTRSLTAADVVLPESPGNRTAPPNRTFTTAFIIAAHQRTDITTAMIESVDILRQYWDPAFGAATEGRRLSNSTL